MPRFDFICENCGWKQEKLVHHTYPKYSKCPKCQENTLIRLIGNVASFVFKGSGFYETDYKKKESKNVGN